jgi:regulator of replication initiation timing
LLKGLHEQISVLSEQNVGLNLKVDKLDKKLDKFISSEKSQPPPAVI